MMGANRGRIAAARSLMAVDRGGHVEELLRQHAPPKGPDRGLAWHLALGTLRWRGPIDLALSPHLSRPIDKLDPGVRAVLRMGLFEAQKSRTPPRAAVHQAVEVVKAIGLKRASGLVNAVLRKTAGSTLSEEPSAALPSWLFERWREYPDWIRRLREPALISICGGRPQGLDCTPTVLADTIIVDSWTLAGGAGERPFPMG